MSKFLELGDAERAANHLTMQCAAETGRSRGGFDRTSIPYAFNRKEPWSYTASKKVDTKPACQEARAVRKGKDQGLLATSSLQGWSKRFVWCIRRREEWYFADFEVTTILRLRHIGITSESLSIVHPVVMISIRAIASTQNLSLRSRYHPAPRKPLFPPRFQSHLV